MASLLTLLLKIVWANVTLKAHGCESEKLKLLLWLSCLPPNLNPKHQYEFGSCLPATVTLKLIWLFQLYTQCSKKNSYSSWIVVIRERGKCYYNLATICKNAFFFPFFFLVLLFFIFEIWGKKKEREKQDPRNPSSIFLLSTVRESEKRKFGASYTTIVR